MKICIVVRILWPGGVQRTAISEAEGLSKLGNEVDLLFIRATKRMNYDTKIKYKVLYDDTSKDRLLGRVFNAITHHYLPQRGDDATVDIDLIYKSEHNYNEKYDLIYYFDEFSALFQKHNKKKFGNRTAVLIHEVAIPNGSFLAKLAQRIAIKNSDIVLTNTKYNLELLHNNDIKNAFEMYPGLTLKNEVPKFTEKENIAISVTMWDFGRKPENLVEIGKHLKTGKMFIVGDWADENYKNIFSKRIKDANLDEKIIVTGPVTEEELQSLYKRAKIFIRFGYDEKGPGMGSLESISWGIPLIINNGIGIKEIVKDKVNGYIVNEMNYIDISTLVEKLFNDPQEWSNISQNNLKLAENMSWDKHNSKLNEIFVNNLISKN